MAKQANQAARPSLCPIPVLTFRRVGLGRTTAFLGEREVGEIMEQATRKAIGAAWMIRFFPFERQWRNAASELAACRAVEDAVNEWLYGAGALDPGCGVRLELPDDLAAEAEAAR